MGQRREEECQPKQRVYQSPMEAQLKNVKLEKSFKDRELARLANTALEALSY